MRWGIEESAKNDWECQTICIVWSSNHTSFATTFSTYLDI